MFLQYRSASRSHLSSRILSLVLMIAVIAAPSVPTWAQGKAKGAASGTSSSGASSDEPGVENKSDKLDVTDLEKKYWAAKDTDFSVVQNRTYTKAGRVALSAQYGVLLNDPYTEASLLSGSLNYYFTERYGVELNYTDHNPSDNEATEAFRNNYGVVPNHGKVQKYYGASFNWVPFYAKMSILNSRIIYFDMSISPGIGVTEYDAQVSTGNVKKSSPTIAIDVTQHFFLSKWFALRFDYKNRFFQEKILKYSAAASGAGPAGTEIKTDTTHNSMLLFGATFFF